MRAFLDHSYRTRIILEEASTFSPLADPQKILEILKSFFEEVCLYNEYVIRNPSNWDNNLSKELASKYVAGTSGVFTLINRKFYEIRNSGKLLLQAISLCPTLLMRQSVAKIQLNAAKSIQQIQRRLIESENTNQILHSTRMSQKRFSQDAIICLMDSFSKEKYPSATEIARLCYHTGLKEKQIVMWFTNRRYRSKTDRFEICKSQEYNSSDTNTESSSPGSPRQQIDECFSPSSLSLLPASEDNFFTERSRQAELEFYQTMLCTNTSHNWIDYAEFFVDIKNTPPL